MLDPDIVFVLGVAAFASIALVILRHKTVLLGFTIFCFFTIARVSLLSFVYGRFFGLTDTWVTPAHLWVFTYTALGLIAFSLGVWIAWRRLPVAPAITPVVNSIGVPPALLLRSQDSISATADHSIPSFWQRLPWLNARFAIVCSVLGGLVYFLIPIAFAIPTIRIVWSTYTELLKFGLLIAVLYSLFSGNYRPLVISTIIFVPMVLYRAVLSGHITAGGFFLIQALLVGCFWRGINLRSIVMALIGMLFIASFLIGWLNSRNIIRQGSLDDLNPVQRVNTFLREFDYVDPVSLEPENLQSAIQARGDASSILAAQVEFQPAFVPFEYGRTILQDISVAFIPRFLWRDKPVVAGGSEFVTRYTGLYFAEGTSVGLPYQFELYANGGAIAVIAGLFGLGWLVARLERSLLYPAHSLPRFLVLLFLTNSIANGGQKIVLVFMSIVIGSISYFLLGKALLLCNHYLQIWQLDPTSTTHARPHYLFYRGAVKKRYL